jgi:hypothetical protein
LATYLDNSLCIVGLIEQRAVRNCLRALEEECGSGGVDAILEIQ